MSEASPTTGPTIRMKAGVGSPFIYHPTRLFFLAFYKVGGIQVFGRENIPRQGGFIFAPNHVSHLDPPMVSIYSPRRPHAMAKTELFSNRFFAKFIEGLGAFPVQRGRPDRKAIRHAIQLLERGDSVLIFPEGTRSQTGELGEPEFGLGMIAHAARAPIVPVYIKGTDKSLSPQNPGVKLVKTQIHYGTPMRFEEEYSQRGTRELYEEISRRVVQEIAALRDRAA